MKNIIYFFKRKLWQIKNLLKWTPIIWEQFDFDYGYALNAFKFQLKKTADFLESDKAMTVEAKNNAKRIRTVLRLMEKVYNDDYACEYQQKLKDLYGEDILDWNFIDTKRGDGSSLLKYNYEINKSEEEIKIIDEMQDKLFKESRLKQEKAHKLLWNLIEHNIRRWWD